jgi:hypothetical protein
MSNEFRLVRVVVDSRDDYTTEVDSHVIGVSLAHKKFVWGCEWAYGDKSWNYHWTLHKLMEFLELNPYHIIRDEIDREWEPHNFIKFMRTREQIVGQTDAEFWANVRGDIDE